MKKFEEELFSEVPCKFGLSTEGEYKQSILVKHFGDWVSPEDHQFKVGEVQDDLSCANEEIERLNAKLEKQQPEIPYFVAELIKYAKENRKTIRWCLYGNCKDLYPQAAEWIGADDDIEFTEKTWEQQETFVHAWLNGYTVAKEKRFYLKNKLTGCYLYKAFGGIYAEQSARYINDDEDFNDDCKFTQSEIDSMETGSYEQIPAEEEV